MILIWGTKGRVTPVNDAEILEKACPQCSDDLELSDLKKWFTIFWIPVFPYSHIETMYHCYECESSFREDAKDVLIGSSQDKETLLDDANRAMAVTLTACMTHMAKIDGNISKVEKDVIFKLKESFADYSKDIDKTFKNISKAKNNQGIYDCLKHASTVLPAEGIMMMMGQVTRVLLADGKIDKKEKALMKEYMLVAGVPQELYPGIIDTVKKSM